MGSFVAEAFNNGGEKHLMTDILHRPISHLG
jgi:hypothetical protein